MPQSSHPIQNQRISHLHFRLTVMSFLQFFCWGAWLITLGSYLFEVMKFDGKEVGLIYATAGIASIVMPALLGYLADKWLNAERVLGICMLFTGMGLLALGLLPAGSSFLIIFVAVLFINSFYMPTLSITNTVAYSTLERNGDDVVKAFPPIRVWGTVGFIAAMWLVNLLGVMTSPIQFFIAGSAAIILAIYAITLPACCPEGKGKKTSKGLLAALGLDAFVLFKERKMALFFIFAMLLGAALQLTNAYGHPFLESFSKMALYEESFAVKYPSILLSLSQISETLFILAIPFFLKRFGIKRVILISLSAWVLRFALFGIGNPGFPGVIALILSMVVYGMAFDFFNISGSIFVESETLPSMRAGAQGLFILMTNGLGTIIGTIAGGWVVDLLGASVDASKWPQVWYIFAAYALIVTILFAISFKHKEPVGIKKG